LKSGVNEQLLYGTSLLRARKRLHQRGFDLGRLSLIELAPTRIGNIKDIQRVTLFGCDLRENYVDTQFGERVRNLVGEAGLVFCLHPDGRAFSRSFRVEAHLWLRMNSRDLPPRARELGSPLLDRC